MDELACKYVETRDKKIVDELYKLAKELERLEKGLPRKRGVVIKSLYSIDRLPSRLPE
jgi:hypothetical protein